jgi:hypothetical protein
MANIEVKQVYGGVMGNSRLRNMKGYGGLMAAVLMKHRKLWWI